MKKTLKLHGSSYQEINGQERLEESQVCKTPYEEQVLTPSQLYDQAVVKIVVTFEYYTVDDHSTQIMMQNESIQKNTLSFLCQK